MPSRNRGSAFVIATFLAGSALAGCSSEVTSGAGGGGGGGASEETIYAIASSLPAYSSLVAAVDKAGLAAALSDAGAELTVFAPDNDAFAALLASVGAASLDDVTADQLRPILRYHVLGEAIDGAAATSAARSGAEVIGLGGSIELGLQGESLRLDGRATVVVADVAASNGIIHGIDAVLLPSITDVATTAPELTSLAEVIGAADGGEGTPKIGAALDAPAGLGAYTVFAPSNAAFTALGAGAPSGQALTNVLLYHVVEGASPVLAADALGLAAPTPFSTLRGDTAPFQIVVSATGGPPADTVEIDDAGSDVNARVTVANLFTSNGVVHIVDKVLLPGG